MATPSNAASSGISYACPSGYNYHWCERISTSTGDASADIDVYTGSDGHDYINADIQTDNQGQNLWVLTWNGTGWNWAGTPANSYHRNAGVWVGSAPNIWDGDSTLIKIAIYDSGLGHYIYSDAH